MMGIVSLDERMVRVTYKLEVPFILGSWCMCMRYKTKSKRMCKYEISARRTPTTKQRENSRNPVSASICVKIIRLSPLGKPAIKVL